MVQHRSRSPLHTSVKLTRQPGVVRHREELLARIWSIQLLFQVDEQVQVAENRLQAHDLRDHYRLGIAFSEFKF